MYPKTIILKNKDNNNIDTYDYTTENVWEASKQKYKPYRGYKVKTLFFFHTGNLLSLAEVTDFQNLAKNNVTNLELIFNDNTSELFQVINDPDVKSFIRQK